MLILLLAAFLRFYKLPSYMEFLGDQGRDVVVVRRFLTKGDLMFIGPQTSIGNMYLGPWYYYLIAPFLLLFNFSPVGPAALVAFLGIVTVWLVYKVGKEWFGEKAGLMAALFTAVSPVLTYYSIFSWNPNIMPFFGLWSIWLTWRIWQREEYKKFLLLAVSLTMVLNSHYLGLLLFPPILFFYFLGFLKTRKNQQIKKQFLRHTLYFILLFLFLMSPLLLFDLKHSLSNYNAIYKFFSDRQATVNLKWYKGLFNLPVIFNQLLTNFLLRKDFWQWSYLFLPLFVIGAFVFKKNKQFLFLLTFLIFGLLGLANYKQHIYAHYFLFLYPLVSLALGAVLNKLTERKSRFFIAAGFCILSVCLMILNWHGFREPNNQMKNVREITDFILQNSESRDFAFALIAERNYDPPYRYFFDLKKAPVVDLHKGLPSQLFVVCEPWGKVNCDPVGHPLWEIAAFGWARISGEWQINGVKVFRLIHTK